MPQRSLFRVLILLVAFGASRADAFNASDVIWSQGETIINVNFSQSNAGLDTKFQTAFEEAITSWNNDSTFQFNLDNSSAEDPCDANANNGVSFETTHCGAAFGSSTLAVQGSFFIGGERSRTTIVFNANKTWDVYSGSLQSGLSEFRRVAVHELGHSIGLGHESIEPAIMHPIIGNIETPTGDDLDGVAAMYDADGDGVGLANDNCTATPNPDQFNLDADDLGDDCDPDIDGDGVFNARTIDQEYSTSDFQSSAFLFGDGGSEGAMAQTFTVGIDGLLEAVVVPMYCLNFNRTSDLQVSIQTVSGENPTGMVLSSVTHADGFAQSNVGLITLELPPIEVSAGDQLAMVFDSTGSCLWRASNGNAFAGGSGRFYSIGSGQWFALSSPDLDQPFATMVRPAVLDNCTLVHNPDQADTDMNLVGDACDGTDSDNDLILEASDNCPLIANFDQLNFDDDAFGDVCDPDIDDDGALNAVDTADMDALICSDNDSDGCNDCSSGTFSLTNDGLDRDSNGICDIGDTDDDGDTVADGLDNCPLTSNLDQANLDNDLLGDVCDPDADGDLALSGVDSNDLNAFVCSDIDTDFCDDCSSGSFNPLADGLDTNGNGVCNLGDPDDDGDGVLDNFPDNCPLTVNPDQEDSNGNGIGNACDVTPQGLCVPIKTKNNAVALICL